MTATPTELSERRPASGPAEPDRFGSFLAASTSGFHRIAYTDWGPVDSPSVVVCVHGLTRQGRDFDLLAADLARQGHRVVCPDLVGRGRSGWLPNSLEYVFPQYCADMSTLLATLGGATVSWVGSSLGGLVGIVLAGLRGTPVRRLVVNDIGPHVPFSAATRVALLLGRMRSDFASLEEAEAFFRTNFAGYGDLPDENWRHITRYSVDWDAAKGRYVLLFDMKIVAAFHMFLYYQLSLWESWERIAGDILCVRGRLSDFVPDHVIRDMRRRTPKLEVMEVDGVGHMPMLMSPAEIAGIGDFLAR